jgi:hypothetical protein
MAVVKERIQKHGYVQGRGKTLEKFRGRKRDGYRLYELPLGHSVQAGKETLCPYCHRRTYYRRVPFLRMESKFIRLRDEWKVQRQHESSTTRMVMLPAYQQIIGMGQDVVPMLLRELETDLDAWFWALRAITEADPVREEDRGNGEAMARAWLLWAKEQGIQW